MPSYPAVDDMDELWPEEGYAVIVEDQFKSPDDEDFINILSTFDSPDFELPPETNGYTYWVHDAEGDSFSRSEWNGEETVDGEETQ